MVDQENREGWNLPEPPSRNIFDRIQRLFSRSKRLLKPGAPTNPAESKEGAERPMSSYERMGIKPPSSIPGTQNIFQKNMKFIIIGIVVLVLFVVVKGCLGGKKQSLEQLMDQPGSEKEEVITVKAYKAGRYNYEDPFNALGTIKGAMEIKLSFEIPGVISSINYKEGERYEEGALLMSLRQDDILLRLKRAQAELNKSQTQVQINEDKYNEHEKLSAMGAISKTTLDKVKLEVDSSKYEMEAARLEVKAHEAMLEKSNIYAPSLGMIGALNIEEGETVTPNSMLGTHVNTEYVFAEFGAGERDVNKIALGQKARVFVDAFADKSFEGVIENVAPVVSGTSRTASVRVRIENPDGLLLPGMFARIRILLYSKKNALVVPTDAIQGSEQDQFIYVIKQVPDQETATAEKRPIAIGYRRDDYCQVDAGLSEGELVAMTALERLADGKQVRVVDTQEAETQ